jgi:hypothetical protein
MTFSEPQIKLLSSKLNGKHVRTREMRGRTLSYIEGWYAIAEANRVFGFDSWDRETVWAECVWSEAKRDTKLCAYAARVRIKREPARHWSAGKAAVSATAVARHSAKRTKVRSRRPRPMP